MDAWLFDDPPDLATFTTRQVFSEGAAILFVTHDEDDGGWQFLPGGEPDVANGLIAGLGCMVDLDPTLADLADLPLGWWAWRDRSGSAWHRGPADPADD